MTVSFKILRLSLRSLLWAFLPFMLVGCGVKGPPEPPPYAKDYPKQEIIIQEPQRDGTVKEKKHEPFVLDELLR